jgi:hypothetical protein
MSLDLEKAMEMYGTSSLKRNSDIPPFWLRQAAPS